MYVLVRSIATLLKYNSHIVHSLKSITQQSRYIDKIVQPSPQLSLEDLTPQKETHTTDSHSLIPQAQGNHCLKRKHIPLTVTP